MDKPVDIDALFGKQPATIMTGKPPENAASARAAHEARTGMKANMQQLGWKCTGYGADCEPKEFRRMVPAKAGEFVGKHGGSAMDSRVAVTRVRGSWSLRLMTKWQGVRYEKTMYIDAPTFPGPVVAATWLAIELASGPVPYLTAAKDLRN